MSTPAKQLDSRFHQLHDWLALTARPPRGWVRAIRQALGMTTGQLAKRLNVAQPRINELEAAEVSGKITLQSLERAAEALGCRVVYVLIPEKPLAETLEARAKVVADRSLASVEQTMRLENQEVTDVEQRRETLQNLKRQLLEKPSQLWNDL
jgi:predicted DNA-binding mobile mystery protein A